MQAALAASSLTTPKRPVSPSYLVDIKLEESFSCGL
jgi:hypothetical protein